MLNNCPIFKILQKARKKMYQILKSDFSYTQEKNVILIWVEKNTDMQMNYDLKQAIAKKRSAYLDKANKNKDPTSKKKCDVKNLEIMTKICSTAHTICAAANHGITGPGKYNHIIAST